MLREPDRLQQISISELALSWPEDKLLQYDNCPHVTLLTHDIAISIYKLYFLMNYLFSYFTSITDNVACLFRVQTSIIQSL